MNKRLIPFIFLIICLIIWWSPDYLKPETYFSIGDALFPFISDVLVLKSFFSWQEFVNEGLGSGQQYKPLFLVFYWWFFGFLAKVGIPLWICNRLYFIFPTWMILFSSYHMILSFIGNKYIVGIIAAIFVATSPPLMFLDPNIQLSFAGMIVSFASVKKYLDTQERKHLVFFSLGIALMVTMPRYIYLGVFFYIIFFILYIILNNNRKYFLKALIIPLISMFILILFLNFYTFLPLCMSLLQNSSTSKLMPNQDAYLHRISVIDFYKNTASLLYSLRLVNNNQYSLYFNYFNNKFNLSVSFLLVCYLFTPLIIKKINKGIICIYLTSLFFLLWAHVFTLDIYKLLIKKIFGLWIINNIQYIVTPLVLIYSILIAYATASLIQYVKTKSHTSKKIISFVIIICVSFLVIVNNGIYFFDRLPSNRKLFVTGEESNVAMGNHLPYFRLPIEYQNINTVLDDKDKNARVFVLPFLSDGYMRYSWWPYATMPEILSSLTYMRLGGISHTPSTMAQTIKKYLLCKKYEQAFNILKHFNYKYIFIHKDMLPYSYYFKDELTFYLSELSKNEMLDIILDNKYFRLCKLNQ